MAYRIQGYGWGHNGSAYRGCVTRDQAVTAFTTTKLKTERIQEPNFDSKYATNFGKRYFVST